MRWIDPIFVTPRWVERDWGRSDLGQWRPGNSGELAAEAWLSDHANPTDKGPLGRTLAASTQDMLGDLGRAPPKLRLVFPGRTTSIKSTAPVSLWTVLEPGCTSVTDSEFVHHRPGDRIRAYEGAAVTFAAGSVALEASSTFLPSNDGLDAPLVARLPPVSARRRATLFRDPALSVESWMLPEWSRIEPDGETCHVLTALTAGVTIDGRRLPPGRAVLVPAWGRPLDLTADGVGAKVMVAYPDATPTSIWRHTPGPDPAAGRLPKPQPAQPRAEANLSFVEATSAIAA